MILDFLRSLLIADVIVIAACAIETATSSFVKKIVRNK